MRWLCEAAAGVVCVWMKETLVTPYMVCPVMPWTIPESSMDNPRIIHGCHNFNQPELGLELGLGLQG